MSQEQWHSIGGGGRGRGGRKGGRGRGRGRGRGGGGRGRGKKNNAAYNSGRNNNNRSSNANNRNGPHNKNNFGSHRQPRQPLVPNTKKNGEKGADAHTVSEKTRIRFTQILMDFREDEGKTKCEFPSDLTNTERKFLHQLALQLGLKSKSHGKGENRKITVTKPDDSVKQASRDDLPLLTIGGGGVAALAKHVSRFPLTKTEELESKETGASLVAALSQKQTQHINDNGDGNDGVLEALERLGLGNSDSHASKRTHRDPNTARRVDTSRRVERHAFYQKRKQEGKEYKQVLSNRAKLPAYSRQEEIVATVAANPVTVIQGETGCGKSTQCPQFLLDANPDASIAVTQRKCDENFSPLFGLF